MGVPSINNRQYYNNCHFLFDNIVELLLKSGSESILKVLQAQHDDECLASDSDVDVALAQVAAAQTSDGANDDGVETFLDVVVSYDGTWMHVGTNRTFAWVLFWIMRL